MKLGVTLDILNQKGTPAFFADTLANRPAAGFTGRIFVSTDTLDLYRDTGTTWVLLSPSSTGTITGSGAAGQVTYFSAASSITGSNELFFDSVNGHLGIGTITPGTALDVKHNQSTLIQIEQETATNDTRLAFINSGVGLWRLGAFYNAGANDFGLFDIAAAVQPFTIKRTTGQVLIGTTTTGSGKLVVASTTGDNGVQIVGATAPSLRIDSAESGPTKRIGIGLATAVNNFIQNSQNLDMCIFNGSTSAAGNMLFGIYDTALANVQEAARISAARNFLVGGITDTGQKLQVSGTALITGAATFSSSVTANSLVIKNSGVPAAQFYRDLDVTVVGSAGQGIEFGARSGSTFIAGAAIYGGLDNPATTGNLVFQTLTAGSLGIKMVIKSTGVINLTSIPTSAVGLVSGDIYSNAGILTIVP